MYSCNTSPLYRFVRPTCETYDVAVLNKMPLKILSNFCHCDVNDASFDRRISYMFFLFCFFVVEACAFDF